MGKDIYLKSKIIEIGRKISWAAIFKNSIRHLSIKKPWDPDPRVKQILSKGNWIGSNASINITKQDLRSEMAKLFILYLKLVTILLYNLSSWEFDFFKTRAVQI
jgi:hypothetical protein